VARAASAPAAASATAGASIRKRAPTPAIPRNDSRDTVQTLTPSGGIDE
jgi:penicillin-binding protein 2